MERGGGEPRDEEPAATGMLSPPSPTTVGCRNQGWSKASRMPGLSA